MNGHANGAAKKGGVAKAKKYDFKPVNHAEFAQKGMALYRAPSLLQPHRAREAILDSHQGKIPPLLGYYMGLSSPPLAKVVAQLGYDLVWIDWEHASTNVETMTQMVHDIQFISEGRTHALVRVPGHDHAAIGFALDAGASIVCPQVDTVEQAQHIVSAAKFGAIRKGTRSAPPARFMPGLSDTPVDPSRTLHECLNDQAAIIIQIETVEGIHNLDDILTECGEYIDSVWLGSLDARVSMGLSGMGGVEPEWLEAVALFESTLTKHNQAVSGFSLGPPEVRAVLSKGKSFLMVAADFHSIVANGLQDLASSRTEYKQQSQEGVYKRIDI